MKTFKQPFLAVLLAIICGSMVIGSISLTFLESGSAMAQANSQAPFFLIPNDWSLNLVTESPAEDIGMTIGIAGISSQAAFPQPTACPNIPEGWTKIVTAPDDTIGNLARRYSVSEDALVQGNCLLIPRVEPGSELSVPPLAAVEVKPTNAKCYPRLEWVRYPVRFGDTLYSLSVRVGVPMPAIIAANCLTSTSIEVGQILRLPFYPQVPVATLIPSTPIIPPTTLVPLVTPFYPTATTVTPVPATTLPPVITTVPPYPPPVITTVPPNPPPATTEPPYPPPPVVTTVPPNPPPVETTAAPYPPPPAETTVAPNPPQSTQPPVVPGTIEPPASTPPPVEIPTDQPIGTVAPAGQPLP